MESKGTLALEFSYQGQTSRLESSVPKCTIGRSPFCEFSLVHVHVISREHLTLEIRDNAVWITDLNSSNGSFYQEVKLTPQVAYPYYGGILYLGTPDQGLSIQIVFTAAPVKTEVSAVRDQTLPALPLKNEWGEDAPKSFYEFEPHPNVQVEAKQPIRSNDLDQNLMQMQVAESELDKLTAKVAEKQLEVDRLSTRESEFKKAELEFNTHEACLILMKEEMISSEVSLGVMKNEIAQLDFELNATHAQLKSHTALALEKSLELDERLKHLALQEAACLVAEQKLEEWKRLAREKSAEVALGNDRLAKLEVTAKAFQAEQGTYASAIKASQDEVAALEAQLSETVISRVQAKREHDDLLLFYRSEVENREALKLKADQNLERAELELQKFEKKAQLERETLEAAARLRKMQLEREAEESITRKILAERDGDDAKRKAQDAKQLLNDLIADHESWSKKRDAERSLIESLSRQSEALQVELGPAEARLDGLKLEQKDLAQSIILQKKQFVDETRALREADSLEFEIHKRLRLELEKAKTEIAFAAGKEQLQDLQFRIQSLEAEHAQSLAQFEQKRLAMEQEQLDQNRLFASQYEEASRRAHQAHESSVAALKEAALSLKQQQAEELRLWSAQEDARIKTVAAENASVFAHHVAMRALAEHRRESSVSVAVLVNTLEKKIVEALNGQVLGEGVYNPDFKTGVRKFWMQAAGVASAAVILALGVQYGPRVVGHKLEVMKVANQQADAQFMQEIKLERERMLALNLQARDSFQESYVDNVLYNRGYLTVKLNSEIQKEWTVMLSQFFFQELLFDDRKVVEYIPIEASLMSSLNENFKILNSHNFSVNLEKMKKIEAEKLESMWLLVGGKENWLKLRKKEAEFYAKHSGTSSSAARLPSGK